MEVKLKKKVKFSDTQSDISDISEIKLDILTLNQGWNDNNEKFIVNIGENSASFKYMHEKLASRYIFYDRIFKIFITISTVIVTADYYITLFQATQIGSIVQTIISTILAITSLIYNFLNFAELSKDHTHYASLFGIVYHDIRNIMCLYRKDRPAAIRYIQHTIKEYDHLEVSGPNIPSWQLYNFQKKFKHKNISMPEVDKIQKIEIIIEPGKINDPENVNKNITSNFTINNENNLHQIQECFKIDGDLSEINNITYNDLLERKIQLTKQSDYELNRFMSNIKNGE